MKWNRTAFIFVLMLALLVPASASADGFVAKAPKPSKVELSASEQTILPGQVLDLAAAVLPAGASQRVTWKSSNKAIATVSSSGRVVGVKKGKAKITATTKTGNKKASCVVTVSQSFSGVNVHFYGIGNDNYPYPNRLYSCIYDVNSMASLYGKAYFGGKAANVHTYTDQTAAGITSVLNTMVNDPSIGVDDISVFYYSGHGYDIDEQTPSQYHGALVGIDLGPVTVNTVQSYLDQVKGTVIVVLDSCYSGQFIKSKGSSSASLGASARASNNAWTSALSRSKATNFSTKALPDSSVRTKYRIMTAASNSQVSVELSDNTGKYGLFTQYLTKYMDNMRLDANGDRVVTLHEAYKLLTKGLESFKKAFNKGKPKKDQIEQVLCVWPSSNAFPIYARN